MTPPNSPPRTPPQIPIQKMSPPPLFRKKKSKSRFMVNGKYID